MVADETPQTAAQWFEHGVRCFKVPDGIAAVHAFEQVLEIDPAYRHSDGDNAYFYLGKISEVEGRIGDALVYYTRALALDPWDEESLIGRGSCLTVQNQHDRAIADFKKVLAIDPRQRRVALQHICYAIAENYRKQSNWDAALTWGQHGLAAEPQNDRLRQLVSEAQAKGNTNR